MNPTAKKMPVIHVVKQGRTGRTTAGKKPLAKSGRDSRKSRRYIVPPARQSCKLKVGGKVLSASLVNESQGGFAVWTDRLHCLKTGEKVRLHTDKGWFTVRVVYVKRVAKSQDTKLRLGLKKVGGFLCLLDTTTRLEEGRQRAVEAEATEESSVRTKSEIEAAVSEEISRFEQDYMGQEPKHVYICLLGDLLVVRLRSALAEAELRFVKLLPAEKGRGLMKEVRSHLIAAFLPVMETMVEQVTGVKVMTTNHDINATTGEEVLIFTLARPPDCLK
jgi:uncharacterized protein YbcI